MPRRTHKGIVPLLPVAWVVCAVASLHGWHNGGDAVQQPPKFGTHDYIAYKALERVPAAGAAWIKQNLTAYFIGTEAPDTGKTVAGVTESGYKDSIQCHCILFDAQGTVTRPRAEQRTLEEFNRAMAALHAGKRAKAAFHAGAMAHYVGDLSQFCHVMGAQSHWGAEDQKLHAAYENAIDRTVDYKTRTSTMLDKYLSPTPVEGTTPESIAEAVARFAETGGHSSRTPGWMILSLKRLGRAGKIGKLDAWTPAFRDQTGQNVNYSVNAVGKLLRMIADSTT